MTLSKGTTCFFMGIPVLIERSYRKSLSLSVTKNLQLRVKAPYGINRSFIDKFVERNREWISSRIEMQKGINELKSEYSSSTPSGRAKRKEAFEFFSARTSYWAEIMDVKPNKIRLSSAEKRFGSCNSKGEISYSVILMHFPPEDRDAVIVHELAHLKEMNHGNGFYDCVLKAMPEYRTKIKKLKTWMTCES